jgi:hypothetical protein
LKYLKCIAPALLALALSACASSKFKAPKCEGTYEPANAPERYLKGAGHE